MTVKTSGRLGVFLLVGSLAPCAGAAVLVHGVGIDSDPSSSTASFITSWSDAGVAAVNGTGTLATSSAINGNVGGEAFTYQIQIEYTGSDTGDNLALGATNGLLGSHTAVPASNADMQTDSLDDEITVSIINISNANVLFDGFAAFSNGNFARDGGHDDIVDVNGTDYSGNSGAFTFALVAGPEPTFVYSPELAEDSSVSSATLRYVDFQFSNVPEPGSLALMGLGGLAMLRRRRA